MMYARAAANFQPGIPITASHDEILIFGWGSAYTLRQKTFCDVYIIWVYRHNNRKFCILSSHSFLCGLTRGKIISS